MFIGLLIKQSLFRRVGHVGGDCECWAKGIIMEELRVSVPGQIRDDRCGILRDDTWNFGKLVFNYKIGVRGK